MCLLHCCDEYITILQDSSSATYVFQWQILMHLRGRISVFSWPLVMYFHGRKLCIFGGRFQKLINLDKLPVYVDKRIHKIIKRATHIDLEKRYSNTSEFFLDLHKLGSVPDWLCESDDKYICRYEGVNYQIRKDLKGYALKKACKNGSWRKVRGVEHAASIEEIFETAHNIFK